MNFSIYIEPSKQFEPDIIHIGTIYSSSKLKKGRFRSYRSDPFWFCEELSLKFSEELQQILNSIIWLNWIHVCVMLCRYRIRVCASSKQVLSDHSIEHVLLNELLVSLPQESLIWQIHTTELTLLFYLMHLCTCGNSRTVPFGTRTSSYQFGHYLP